MDQYILAPKLKIVIMGQYGVGKSSLILSYIRGSYQSDVNMTMGVVFFSKTLDLANNEKVVLNIWDTAGSERFHSLVPMYIRDALTILLCVDVPNIKTIKDSIQKIKETNSSAKIIIVATKTDLLYYDKDESTITSDYGKETMGWAPSQNDLLAFGLLWMEINDYSIAEGYQIIFVSSLTNLNVSYLFYVAAVESYVIYKNIQIEKKNITYGYGSKSGWGSGLEKNTNVNVAKNTCC